MPIFTYKELYTELAMPRLRSMFTQVKPESPLSVSRDDIPGKINLYKIYMDLVIDDPSEVTFAESVFGDIIYWNRLTTDKWFAPYIDEWRFAASEKRKSLAFKAIMSEVKSNGKSSFTAAKYLIEEPWLSGSTASEKKQIAKAKEASTSKAYHAVEFAKDIERLKEEGVLN